MGASITCTISHDRSLRLGKPVAEKHTKAIIVVYTVKAHTKIYPVFARATLDILIVPIQEYIYVYNRGSAKTA